MAKKTKSDAKTTASDIPETVEDAEIIDSPAAAEPEVHAEPEAESIDGTPETQTPDPEPAPDAPAEPAQDIMPHTPEPKAQGSFVPLVLGGVLAAALGYLVPTFLMTPTDKTGPLVARIATNEAALRQTQADLSQFAIPDLTPLEAGLSAQAEALAALEARITALEARPVGETGVTEGDLAELRANLEAQRTQSAALTQELSAMAARQEAGLANAETEALNAARAAEQAALRQSLSAALSNGAPFAEVAAQMDPPLPEAALAAADSGIPTAQSLTDVFPDLARAALSAARTEAATQGDTSSRLVTFLRAQVGARSVEPRAGTSPDAILSRAEAAAKAGDFATAVTEIDGLPDPARTIFATWHEQAQTRATAASALTSYLSAQ